MSSIELYEVDFHGKLTKVSMFSYGALEDGKKSKPKIHVIIPRERALYNPVIYVNSNGIEHRCFIDKRLLGINNNDDRFRLTPLSRNTSRPIYSMTGEPTIDPDQRSEYIYSYIVVNEENGSLKVVIEGKQ